MINYEPKDKNILKFPVDMRRLPVKSAWMGLEDYIEDIIEKFDITRFSCIEFGVEFGFSTVAFSNYFQYVVGVDTFKGDVHAGAIADHFEETKKRLEPYTNIQLVQSDYKDYINWSNEQFNMAHVDIVHTYQDTFDCGDWACKNCDIVLFHDTESFPDVKKAVTDLANKHGMEFHNIKEHYGLGILVNKNKTIEQ